MQPIAVDCVTECPICSKTAMVPPSEFFFETTCPSCKYCYGPVYYFDAAHAFNQLSPDEFRDWLEGYVINSNRHYTFEKFTEGIRSKELVVLFPLADASRILGRWRRLAWASSVAFYRFGPPMASLLISFLARNPWYLGGIALVWIFGKAVSKFLRQTMQQIQVVCFFAIPLLILWYFFGLLHWSTFSVFCVIWWMGGFFVSDWLQGKLAVGGLLQDQGHYEKVLPTAHIFISPAPSSSSTRMRKF